MDSLLTPYAKINFRWIKEIHVLGNNIKLLKYNEIGYLYKFTCENDFLKHQTKGKTARLCVISGNYLLNIHFREWTITQSRIRYF